MKSLVTVVGALLCSLLLAPLKGQQLVYQVYYVSGAPGSNTPGAGLIGSMTPGAEFPPPPPFVLPQGYRTIGFAMAEAWSFVSVSPATRTARIFIQGGQDYSFAANGEVFPIVMKPGVGLEGTFVGLGFAALPNLAPPAGVEALQFTGAADYPRDLSVGGVTYQASDHSLLRFSGGSCGVKLGAAVGYRHRPRFDHCEFLGQTATGIRIYQAGAGTDDPKIYRSIFSGPARGIEQVAVGVAAVAYADIEDCTFRNLGGVAIWLEDTSVGGGNVGSGFRANNFENCYGGIYIRSGSGATTTNAIISKCRFKNITWHAVQLDLVRPIDPRVTVDECVMMNCAEAVRFTGTPLPGIYALTVNNCAIRDCNVGIHVILDAAGGSQTTDCSVASRDNEFVRCTTGMLVSVFKLSSSAANLSFLMSSQRDVMHDCVQGVNLSGDWPGQLLFESDIIAGGTTGFFVNTNMPVTLRSSTLARCLVAGINVWAAATNIFNSGTFQHLIFDRIGINVVKAVTVNYPSISYSCFEGAAYSGPGTNNLQNVNPQLDYSTLATSGRASYKLLPNSPCIDSGNPIASLPAFDYENDPRPSQGLTGALPPYRMDIGADEFVYSGSARTYGARGFGTYNVFPRISSPNSTVQIGGSVQIDLSEAWMPVFLDPAHFAFLLFGWADSNGTLPFDLFSLGFQCGYVWTDAAATVGFAPQLPLGTASRTIAIPNNAALFGVTFTSQWLVGWIPGSPYQPVSSNGLRVTIGR
jgi:Right handed beta helix region